MSLDSFLVTDTIPASGTQGGGIYIGDCHLVHIFMPAAWTAANLTFQTSPDGVTWQNCFDETGTESTVQVAAGRNARVAKDLLPAVGWLKVRSGTSGTPVTQSVAAIITFKTRRYR